jgi:hypothetical protein
MLKRQNDQIQQLREEIKGLRRLIEERLQPQVRRGENEQQPMNMDSEMRMLEERVKREPNSVEAHMRLGELYSKRGKIDAAINQYEMVTKIRPDFDPPYAALERLRNQGKEREAQPEGEFNMGEVISSNMEYVTIKTFEGNTVAFKVPRVKKDDGSWVSKMDIPEKGARVRIFWNGVEGQKVIKRMEFLEKERREEAKPIEEYCMGEVISSNMEGITIRTLENGETLTFRVPRVKKDDGSWVLNMDIAERAKSLDKGAKVKIFWNRVEDQRVLRRIEFLNREGQEKEARLSEDFVGEVISSNMEEVTIKTLERGETITFRVPRVKKDDGSLVPQMDIPEKGARVKISWKGVEGQKVITRIEFLEKERLEEAKPMKK